MRPIVIAAALAFNSPGLSAADFEAGAAKADITPPTGHPMWGYSSRKDKPCEGVRDPLHARALVMKAGETKIALVSLDLGRAPTRESMKRIREKLKPERIAELFLVASHTHHGPVIELDTWPKGDRPYVRELEDKLVGVIRQADAARKPARYGIASTETALNRNRQSKRKDAPADREVLVLRVEDLTGKPIAHAVNFAAHPTMHPAGLMTFSADYPGAMTKHVEAETGVPCLFLQGAAGDLSTNSPEGVKGPDEFGKRLGETVLALAKDIKPTGKGGVLAVRREEFAFKCVIDVKSPFVRAALDRAFFPELIGFFEKEYADGVRPTLSVAVLDGAVGFVGVSGEFFSEHALSLKRRARLPHLFFLGYCNDYHQYFPTIQAVSEGGYGTGLPVAVTEVGAGEKVIDRALIHLYQLRGMIPDAAK
ncbi:MAG: Neutral/alkaline non-lysosomal ceramidase [Gemmataceae bacterium]|nr:Neutral/alkaline non-lysosomal ceramidase [Gemmataceae bacterium]